MCCDKAEFTYLYKIVLYGSLYVIVNMKSTILIKDGMIFISGLIKWVVSVFLGVASGCVSDWVHCFEGFLENNLSVQRLYTNDLKLLLCHHRYRADRVGASLHQVIRVLSMHQFYMGQSHNITDTQLT